MTAREREPSSMTSGTGNVAMVTALLLAWAVIQVVQYARPLLPWLRSDILVWIVPFLGAATFPDPLTVLGGALTALLTAALFVGTGLGAGRPIVALLRLPPAGSWTALAAGLAALSAWLLGLGLVGGWRPVPIALSVVPWAVPGLRAFRGVRLSPPGFLRKPVILLPAALMGWLLFLLCLAPETFQDPLRYHLHVPSQFLRAGKIYFLEDFFFWSYMGPLHMWYAAALALGGEAAPKAVNAACALGALGVLLRLAARLGMSESARALWLALVVTAPGFIRVAGSVFVEHGTALFVCLGVAVMLDAKARPGGRLRVLALLLGTAGSVKYTAVFGLAGVAGLFACAPWRGLLGAGPRIWAARLALLACPLLPWALIRWLFTLDPVSPNLARAGWDTMDSASIHALDEAYTFTKGAVTGIVANPAALLAFPAEFSGGHIGFWENPGPALFALLPAVLWRFRRLSAEGRGLLAFSGASLGSWILLFGGVSPHYVAGYYGIWLLSCMPAVSEFPPALRLGFRNLLSACVFLQALITLSSEILTFNPRDVATGVMSRATYLTYGLAPKALYYPLVEALERGLPGRRVLYVLGSDKAFYLPGRIRLDYEYGSDSLLWRLAAASENAESLAKRLAQRGLTHLAYSNRWVVSQGRDGKLRFRYGARTLAVVERFWERHVEPVWYRERRVAVERHVNRPQIVGVYLFRIRRSPAGHPLNHGFCRQLPFLPGAEALVWPGDEALRAGKLDEAAAAYREAASGFPDSDFLRSRLRGVRD